MRGLITCSLVFAVIAQSSAAHSQTTQSDLDIASELVKNGHADQSLALVEPIIVQAMLKDAKDPEALCPGVAAAVLQKYMKGNFSVSIENDWCDAMLVKAYALNELKRPTEAAETLKILVRHAPGNAQYLNEYAYTVRVNGDLNGALELYRQAEKLASRSDYGNDASHWRAAALRGQGFCLSDLLRWDEATKAYRLSMKFERPPHKKARC